MMMGVAQVIGIKPILSCFFSIAPGADKASSAAFAIEKISEIAASVVPIPTAARNARREAASGSTARTMAVSNVAVRCFDRGVVRRLACVQATAAFAVSVGLHPVRLPLPAIKGKACNSRAILLGRGDIWRDGAQM